MNDTSAERIAPWERRGSWSAHGPRSRLDQALTVARRSSERRGLYDWAAGDDGAVVGIFDEPPAEAPPPPRAMPRPEDLVSDLNPPGGFGGPAPRRDGGDWGLGREWGSTWRWTAQGWVDEGTGPPTWRPVVTTTADFPDWQVDTFLGLVTGEAAVADADDAGLLGRALDEGRTVATQGMIDAAVARGAHAVVGAGVAYTPLGGRVVVTATGTAVTLRDR